MRLQENAYERNGYGYDSHGYFGEFNIASSLSFPSLPNGWKLLLPYYHLLQISQEQLYRDCLFKETVRFKYLFILEHRANTEAVEKTLRKKLKLDEFKEREEVSRSDFFRSEAFARHKLKQRHMEEQTERLSCVLIEATANCWHIQGVFAGVSY